MERKLEITIFVALKLNVTNMDKLKIDVEKALPLIEEMIKPIALAKEIGRSNVWLINRKNHNQGSSGEFKFSKEGIFKLNSGIESIGSRLLQTRISYSKEREDTILQIKKLSETVQLSYIYEKRMGKNKSWFCNRTKKSLKGSNLSSFSEDDVLAINLAIMDIGNKLLSIEITL